MGFRYFDCIQALYQTVDIPKKKYYIFNNVESWGGKMLYKFTLWLWKRETRKYLYALVRRAETPSARLRYARAYQELYEGRPEKALLLLSEERAYLRSINIFDIIGVGQDSAAARQTCRNIQYLTWRIRALGAV